MDALLLSLRILLAILLYAFLAAVMRLLWRDLRQASTSSSEAVQHGGRLIVIQAEGEMPAVGDAFPLQPVTSIGRSPDNTVVIPDIYVSAQHALLAWREGQWWLEDRDSTNGTLLNATRISSATVVSSGDVIGVGRVQLRVEIGG